MCVCFKTRARYSHRLRGLTATLDTAATGSRDDWDLVLPHVDEVLLCIKSSNAEKYRKVTRSKSDGLPLALDFLHACAHHGVRVWLRFVLMARRDTDAADDTLDEVSIAGGKMEALCTDGDDEVRGIAAIAQRYKTACVEGVELLPYHTFGTYKWDAMGVKYPLQGMQSPSAATISRVKKQFEALGVRVVL